MKKLTYISAILLVLITAGCTSSNVPPAHAHEPISLTEAQADQIMLISIRQTWPDMSPGKLTDGRLGYSLELQRGLDVDRVTAIAVPTEGKYKFSVWATSLTSGETDTEARDELIRLIIANAETVGEFQ
jgi:hypothetical protein